MAKKKSKGAVLESAPPPSGAGGFHNPSARQKREALMVDYQELQKDTDATRRKLEVAKQKRHVLAAEVGFLRQRYKHLVKAKNTISSEEYSILPSTSLKQAKSIKEQNGGNKVGQRGLPPLPDPRPNKKQCTGKRASLLNTSPSTVLACNAILHSKKETFGYSLNLGSVPYGKMHVEERTLVPIIDRERALVLGSNSVVSRHFNIGNFEVNRYKNSTGQEASLPIRAPTFDLNEISTGDEDLHNNVNAARFEEAKRSLMRSAKDEKFPVCRNAGEGSGTVSKRKISWQDPVVLRV